jgi:hypothetical protein
VNRPIKTHIVALEGLFIGDASSDLYGKAQEYAAAQRLLLKQTSMSTDGPKRTLWVRFEPENVELYGLE